MRLLIVTQKVDDRDDVLGFFIRWLELFAEQFERVQVICLEEGTHSLPLNVRVLSLGKESLGGFRLLKRIRYSVRFMRDIVDLRDEYDVVFVHMNPEYVVLGGLLWRMMGKTVGLWYTHRAVHWKLRVAERLAHVVFSSSKHSFNVISDKLCVVGHGIDTQAFSCPARKPKPPFTILSVGRLVPIKNLDVLIEAAAILHKDLPDSFKVMLVGEAPRGGKYSTYARSLRAQVAQNGLEDIIEFRGSVPHKNIASLYCAADITVNVAPTGGVDKAVLESLVSGRPALVSNEAFREYMGEYWERLHVRERDAADLAAKMRNALRARDYERMAGKLKSDVRKKVDVHSLIERVSDILKRHVRD